MAERVEKVRMMAQAVKGQVWKRMICEVMQVPTRGSEGSGQVSRDGSWGVGSGGFVFEGSREEKQRILLEVLECKAGRAWASQGTRASSPPPG
jgi:hypothetical protein